jgi:hypothetical protein
MPFSGVRMMLSIILFISSLDISHSNVIYVHLQDKIKNLVLPLVLMQSLKIQEMQQKALALHRDIANMVLLLGHEPDTAQTMMLGNNMSLFPDKMGRPAFLGDTAMLGKTGTTSGECGWTATENKYS